MRRILLGILLPVAVIGMTLVSTPAFAKSVASVPIKFNSGSSWKVYDGATLLGSAQNFCASRNTSPTSPPNCPRNAVVYGHEIKPTWQANLAPIPKATWIWAPGITGSTSPADLAAYTFTMTITVTGTPVAATLYLAADDYAAVSINDTLVGEIGSTTDTSPTGAAWDAQNTLHSFNILSYLQSGANTFEIFAQNGFDPPTVRSYQVNPAGVAFGGSISFS